MEKFSTLAGYRCNYLKGFASQSLQSLLIAIKPWIGYMFVFCYCHLAMAQKKPSWEVSTAGTLFNFSGIGPRYGFGVTAEYYLTKNLSVKGSLLANKNYLRVSLAPIFWQYAVSWINEKPGRRSVFPHRLSGNEKYWPLVFLGGLLFSDGFIYRIPLAKGIYFCPYIAPIQFQACLPESPRNPEGGVLSTSLGAGLKMYRKNLVIYAGAEYSQSVILKPRKGFGYSIHASVGYVIYRKKNK